MMGCLTDARLEGEAVRMRESPARAGGGRSPFAAPVIKASPRRRDACSLTSRKGWCVVGEAQNVSSRLLYRTIVADPPWPYKRGLPRWTDKGVDNSDNLPYGVLELPEIVALSVDELAAADCHLYLWTTNAFLESAWDVCRAWGFTPSTVLVWCKPPRGFVGRATFSPVTEYVLFGTRGKVDAKKREWRNWFPWPRGTHSSKPEAFFDMVERVSHGPYLELFARRQRLGWDTWGNEALEHVEVVT